MFQFNSDLLTTAISQYEFTTAPSLHVFIHQEIKADEISGGRYIMEKNIEALGKKKKSTCRGGACACVRML